MEFSTWLLVTSTVPERRNPVPLQAPARPRKSTPDVRIRQVERAVATPISRKTAGRKFGRPMTASNPPRLALARASSSGVSAPRKNNSLARAFCRGEHGASFAGFGGAGFDSKPAAAFSNPDERTNGTSLVALIGKSSVLDGTDRTASPSRSHHSSARRATLFHIRDLGASVG